jgi:hypothetical protein
MNKKTIAKMLGIVVGTSTIVGAFAAHAANGDPMLINPNDGVPYGSWGPVVQANNIFGNADVRGEVSKRHARERLFYNTSANTGGYDRWLRVTCTGEGAQGVNEFNFQNTSDGDKTITCLNGGTLILPPMGISVNAAETTFANTSWAVIQSRAF